MSKKYALIALVLLFAVAVVIDCLFEESNYYADGVILGCSIATGVIVVSSFFAKIRKIKSK